MKSQISFISLGLSVLLCSALMLGNTVLSPFDLWRGLLDANSAQALVLAFRLPRVLLAVFAGMALGLAGCLLQALCRNRIASPEMLGVHDGAAMAVLAGLLLGSSGLLGPWWLGPLGALLACGLLLLLHGKPRAENFGGTFLLLGLGLASLLRAISELALSQQSLQHAASLFQWNAGSLAGHSSASVWPLALLVLPVLLLCIASGKQLRLLQFRAEFARSLGVPLRATQMLALLSALLLAGMAVGICGPIAFVALAAPYFAAHISSQAKLPMLESSLIGAGLLLLADLAGRLMLKSAELPVGVLCNLLGGPFLLVLLLKSSRRNPP